MSTEMKPEFRVALMQTDIHWQNIMANLSELEEEIAQLQGQALDLIVLPEMFTTGFTMQAADCAEPAHLHTFRWLKLQAERTGAVITGSYVVKENNQFYNRLLWVQPDGQFWQYDKCHLFRMAGEDGVYTAGSQKIIPTWKGWRFLPLICYDLRFPVWSRNVNNEYDCLIYVANWPDVRVVAWDALLQARAIENLAYVLGVNRVGTDANGLWYSGHSAMIDPKGAVHRLPEGKVHTEIFTLEAQTLTAFREKFPAHLDADQFEIKPN